MSSRQEREAIRLRVLKAIYDASGGGTMDFVGLWEIREQLGLSDQDMGDAVDYLEGERLIEPLRTLTGQRTPMQAQLTHRGLREMEESEKAPDERTEHFPPLISIVSVGGNMIGSAIQAGSPGATQRVQVGNIAIDGETDSQICAFLAEYDAKLTALQQEWTPDVFAEIAPRIGRVRKEIEASGGDRHLIKDTLASVKAIMENGVGGVVTSGLLLLLGQIHW